MEIDINPFDTQSVVSASSIKATVSTIIAAMITVNRVARAIRM
jgi:hypothetical protein